MKKNDVFENNNFDNNNLNADSFDLDYGLLHKENSKFNNDYAKLSKMIQILLLKKKEINMM